MSSPTVQFNDYVSLVIMLLMFVALLGGRSGSTALADDGFDAERPSVSISAYPHGGRLSVDADGQLGEQALKVSIAVVGELSHFRGEDE